MSYLQVFTMARSIIGIVLALWVVAIAILSVQNATPISLQFFGLSSIQIPVGVMLAFFAAGGMVVAVVLGQPGKGRSQGR
jgi:uncharacterized integral membrane protein